MIEAPFSYDLEKMKIAVESPRYSVPDFKDLESFDAWLNDETKVPTIFPDKE